MKGKKMALYKVLNWLQEKMNEADYDDMRYHEDQDHEAMERAKNK